MSTSDNYWENRNTVKTVYNSAVNKPQGSRVEQVTRGSNGLTETTEFSIGLNAAVGASYALIPGRFTVNAGIGITPVDFTSTTTKFSKASTLQTTTTKTYDADGKPVSTVVTNNSSGTDSVTDSVKVEDTWEPCTVNASAGFTFNFNENIALDMSVYARSDYTDIDMPNNTLNNSNANGFNLDITNVQVLFRVKF